MFISNEKFKRWGNTRFRKFLRFVSTIVIGMHYCPVGCLFCSLLGMYVFMSLLGFLSISLDWHAVTIYSRFNHLISPLTKWTSLRYHRISYLNQFTLFIKSHHFKSGGGVYLHNTSVMSTLSMYDIKMCAIQRLEMNLIGSTD